MTLKDTGADSVAWGLSEAGGGGRQITGSFTRKGAVLEGTRPFQVQGANGQLAVKARIESPDRIAVHSSVFTPSNSKQAPTRDNTTHYWTRKAVGETATPDDAEEPSARPPGYRPTMQQPRMRKRPT